jgi:hypothetical protein
MTPKRLIIERSGGLFPLPEIVIEGQLYSAVKMTRPLWIVLRDLEKRIKAGDMSAYYEQVQVMTEAPSEAVDLLDVQDVKRIIEFLMAHAMHPEDALEETEKKTFEPGPITVVLSPGPSPDDSPAETLKT